MELAAHVDARALFSCNVCAEPYATASIRARDSQVRAGAAPCRPAFARSSRDVAMLVDRQVFPGRGLGRPNLCATATLCSAQRSSAEGDSSANASLESGIGLSIVPAAVRRCASRVEVERSSAIPSIDSTPDDASEEAPAPFSKGVGSEDPCDSIAWSVEAGASCGSKKDMASCARKRGSAASAPGRRSICCASIWARRDSKTQRATRAFTSVSIHSSMMSRNSLRRLAARVIRDSSKDSSPVADDVRKKSSGGWVSLMLGASFSICPREERGKRRGE